MVQHERAGRCLAAESFQHLRELDVGSTCALHDISLPHGLESAAFRDAEFRGVVWLDTCKCAPCDMLLGSLHGIFGAKHGSGKELLAMLPQGSMVLVGFRCGSNSLHEWLLQVLLHGSIVLGTLLLAVLACVSLVLMSNVQSCETLAGACRSCTCRAACASTKWMPWPLTSSCAARNGAHLCASSA